MIELITEAELRRCTDTATTYIVSRPWIARDIMALVNEIRRQRHEIEELKDKVASMTKRDFERRAMG